MRLSTGRAGLRAARPLGRLNTAPGTFTVLATVSLLLSLVRLLSGTTALAPLAGQIGPLVAGGLLLSLPRIRALLVVVVAGVGVDLGVKGLQANLIPSVVVIGGVAVLAYWLAVRRDRRGMSDVRSEEMLIELRDRLRSQGDIPPLGDGWHVELALRSAGGAAFAGDFVTARTYQRCGEPTLELALVDVSGKGVAAGTRALLLSGAMGGLLGAVPPDRLLVEANDYVVRQDWVEGFATAVHLSLNLRTGGFAVASAGHPPALQLHAGSGRWQVSDAAGPLLGVLPEVHYAPDTGVLAPGDALLLYTDGVVERPDEDLSVGIDRLLGAADRQVARGGFAGSAEVMLESVAPGGGDDCALVLLWRPVTS